MNPFVLKNEELIRLDMDVRYFNLLFNDFYADCGAEILPNPGYVSKLITDCDGFIREVSAVPKKGLTRFENLYRLNMQECLKAQYYFLDYYFLGERAPTVEKFISYVYDYDLRKLEEMFIAFDLGKDARMQQMGAILVENLIDASYGMYLDFLKSILPTIREELVQYASQQGILPQRLSKKKRPYELDFEIILDSEGGAGWDEDVRILTINPDKFRIYKYRDKVAVNPGVAEDYMLHEIIHLAQGAYSSGLPQTLRQDSPQVRSISVAPITEGIATILTERLMEERMTSGGTSLGFEFGLGQEGDKQEFTRVKLRKTELDYMKNAIHFPQYRTLADDFFTWLNLKQRDDEDYDAREVFLESVMKHGEWSPKVKGGLKEKVEILPSLSDGGMFNLPYSLSYYVGYDLVGKIESDIGAERGKAFLRSNRRRLREIMVTGAWSVKVFPRWVRFALDNPEQFDAYREHLVEGWKKDTDAPPLKIPHPPSGLLPMGFDLQGYRENRMFK